MSGSDTPSRGARVARFVTVWTRRAMTLVVLLVVLALLGLVGFWVLGGGVMAERSARLANGLLLDENSRLTIGWVEGFPFSRLVLKDVRVETREGETWTPVLAAKSVELRYDPWGLLHRRYVVSAITLTEPQVRLARRGTSGYALPGFRSSGGGGSRSGVPSFRIRRLEAVGGSLELDLPWRTVRLDSLSLSADARTEDGAIKIGGKELSGVFADSLGSLELADARIVVETGGDEGARLRLENLRGAWGDSRFDVDGTVRPDRYQFAFEVERLPLARLGRFLARTDLDPGHVDRVKGSVTGHDGAVAFRGEGAASWGPWSADSLSGQGDLLGKELRLTDLNARAGDLVVEDATVVVPLDGPGIEVAGRVLNLRPEELPLAATKDLAGVLSGEVRVALRDRVDPNQGLAAEARLEAGELMGLVFQGAALRLRGADSTWAVDSLHVSLVGATLEASGRIGPKVLDARARYEGEIAPLRPFVRNETLAGYAELDAILSGTQRRPVVKAKGYALDVAYEDIFTPRVDLVGAEGPLLEGRELTLDLVAVRGVRLPGIAFDRAQAYLTVTEDALRVSELEAARGDSVVSARGTVRWEPEVTIDLDAADARSEGRHVWMDTPGRLTWVEDRLSASGITLQTARGSLEASGTYDVKTRHADASFVLHRLDPSVAFPPDRPPPVRVGSVSGTVHVNGVLPDVDGEARLDLKAIEWEGGRLDSVSASVALAGRDAVIEDLRGWVEGGAAGVRGRIRLPASLHRTLEAIAVGPEFPPDSLGFDLAGRVSGVQLGRWLAFMPRADRPVGRVDAEVLLAGTAAAPRITLRGRGTDLGWRAFGAQGLAASLTYGAGTVRVDTLTVSQNGKKTEIRGSGPLDLTLRPFSWALPERPIDMGVDAVDGSPDVLRLLPFVQDASGTFNASIRMTGTPKRPVVDGVGSLQGGRVRIRERDEVLENVSARVSIEKNLLTIERADGTLEGGKVRATGTYRLWVAETEAYALRITADRAVVRDAGIYAARVSGNLTLRPVMAKDGRIYPFAEGNLFVHRAEYAGTLEPQDIASFTPQPILYQVGIEAPSQVLVRTEQVDVELGGEVRVNQDVDSRSVLGELDILRGRYQLFLEQFRISEGTLTWSDPTSILPEMDVTAEATVPPYVIVVRLNGRADEPVVESSALLLEGRADAGLTESEVFQVLAAGSVGLGAKQVGLGADQTGTPNGPTSSEAIATGVAAGTTLFGSRLEQALLRRVGLVDEFDIDTDPNGTAGFGLTLGVRKWLTPALSVAYRQGLSQNFEQDVAVEYRLRRALFLRAGYARRQTTSLATGLAQEYNLDLRVRHEY